MSKTDATPADDRGSECNDLLGRLEAHACMHDDLVMHDAEQAQWAADLRMAKAEIERLRSAAEYAAHNLEGARIWGGMEWHYNPLHPLHYRSALERLRDALRPNAGGKP